MSIIARALFICLSVLETLGLGFAPGVSLIIFEVSILGRGSCFGGVFSATLASGGAVSFGFMLCWIGSG